MKPHHLALGSLLGLLLSVSPVRAAGQVTPGIIPKPVALELKPGVFQLASDTRILAGPGAETEAASLSQRLKSMTGLNLATAHSNGGRTPGRSILLELQPGLSGTLGSEGYKLHVRPDGVVIEAPTTAGLFYGGITLAQLASQAPAVPCMEVTDYPRFQWRGMMLDCSRHFMPREFIERFLDLMALQKMNCFHWHLVDCEGWRLEIKKYPKLTQVSQSFPAVYPGEDSHDSGKGPVYMGGHLHGGGYYTQEEVREIVAYAAARHISIMPEIEFPAHSMAALTAYPEFGATGHPPVVPPGPMQSLSPDLYNVDDKSLQFLRDVLAETMQLFPCEYIHFGGDEAPKQQWKNSPLVQQKIKELGLKDAGALQTWLFEQMAEYIAKQGRRAVGWDEIMGGGIPAGAVVMPWTGIGPGIKAANSGHDIIIAVVTPNYFTTLETKNPQEPIQYKGFRGATLAAVYNQTFEYPGIRPDAQGHILGAQGELWAERFCKPAYVEYMAFPRSAALAEALWTPLGGKNFEDFSTRLNAMAKQWDRYVPPVNHHPLTLTAEPAPSAVLGTVH